ncbi:hypothetical protein SELMODRAFT_416114 [Selaginella moellendorffii]|uniref:Uncharacterized protein n=1 Tax=Selaginella moellendorffii TaxID=88036 RepID=D8RY46_SELML|nr:hypothetical protein SELMODRAFT_416114 [Selaginella moellendorffii]
MRVTLEVGNESDSQRPVTPVEEEISVRCCAFSSRETARLFNQLQLKAEPVAGGFGGSGVLLARFRRNSRRSRGRDHIIPVAVEICARTLPITGQFQDDDLQEFPMDLDEDNSASEKSKEDVSLNACKFPRKEEKTEVCTRIGHHEETGCKRLTDNA